MFSIAEPSLVFSGPTEISTATTSSSKFSKVKMFFTLVPICNSIITLTEHRFSLCSCQSLVNIKHQIFLNILKLLTLLKKHICSCHSANNHHINPMWRSTSFQSYEVTDSQRVSRADSALSAATCQAMIWYFNDQMCCFWKAGVFQQKSSFSSTNGAPCHQLITQTL